MAGQSAQDVCSRIVFQNGTSRCCRLTTSCPPQCHFLGRKTACKGAARRVFRTTCRATRVRLGHLKSGQPDMMTRLPETTQFLSQLVAAARASLPDFVAGTLRQPAHLALTYDATGGGPGSVAQATAPKNSSRSINWSNAKPCCWDWDRPCRYDPAEKKRARCGVRSGPVFRVN